MTKEERYQYLDVLAAKAKTDASARDEICRHFKKYIHHLSYGPYEGWEREDAEQDLWVCFLECLFSYDEKKKIHFTCYVMKHLKWTHLNGCRKREVEMGHRAGGELGEDIPDPRNSHEITLSPEDMEDTLSRCPMTEKQRGFLDERMKGKSWNDIARENHLTRCAVYYHVRQMRTLLTGTPEFRETFFA